MSVTLIRPNVAETFASPAAMQAWIDELLEENRRLKAALIPQVILPLEWRVTRFERRLLLLILQASPRVVGLDTIYDAMKFRRTELGDLKVIQVLVCKLRKKLQAHCPKVSIETVHGTGYRMPATAAAALRRILAEENALEECA